MSEITDRVRRRRRRSDAERSASAILDAAVRLIGQRPEVSVEEVAAAAGVTRQTVYAHYPSRRALLDAVVDQITGEVVAAIEAAMLDEGTASAALGRWLETSWQLLDRYPVLLHPSVAEIAPEESREQHQVILDQLLRLVHRGQRAGEFDRDQSADWLAWATIALGHAAGEQVTGGRMTADEAGAALRRAVLRLYGVPDRDD